MNTPEQNQEDHNIDNVNETQNAVDFDGGAFTITYLATNPDGFEVETRNLLSRRQEHGASPYTPEEAARLSKAVRGELRFQGVDKVKEARAALRVAEAEGQETTDLSEKFEAARQNYVKGMIGKVGIRNAGVRGNVLSLDVKSVPFPVYAQFSRPEDSNEILDDSSLSGVAMAVRTSDGRLIIQHRGVAKQPLDSNKFGRGNEVYADIPGASVAGMLDAKAETADRPAGKPDPIDTDFVKAAILKEGDEELGAKPSDFSRLKIVGLAHDNIKVHDEFLILTDSKLTSSQMKEQSRQANRNRTLGDADFEEKFLDIEASPKAIETLLCDVKCPLPPTHSALMVACGYAMVLERDGVNAADAWKQGVETRVADNYKAMDAIVANFYERHPEALEKVPERYWSKAAPERDPNGYSPMFTPEEQGLPSFEDEMVRTGLVPETRQTVSEAYIFDVDGPLSDPKEHKVIEKELLTIISDRLEQGLPVGLNTGRDTKWVMDNLISDLLPHLKNKSDLVNLMIIGEFGATWTTFDEEGTAHDHQSEQLSVPAEFKGTLKSLVEEKYGDTMFFDERPTMCSVVMKQGGSIEDFDRQRLELAAEIDEIIKDKPELVNIRVGQTTIATDINIKYAGKDVGVDRFEQWLKDRNIKPDRYFAFGDSASDIDMAEELDRTGKKAVFVFVGSEPMVAKPNRGYALINAPGFSAATLKTLKSVELYSIF